MYDIQRPLGYRTVVRADIIEWLLSVKEPFYHAALADPPYFMGPTSKRFGSPDAKPAGPGEDGSFGRIARGFMGQSWDGFDSVYDYQAWVTAWAGLMIKRALLPGAIAMFFGGTKTYHRLAVGLEDAGFEIVDTILYAYASGLPKGEANDAEGQFVPMLKPAFEPITVVRAPRPKKMSLEACYREYGTGSFWIGGTRIGNSKPEREAADIGQTGVYGSGRRGSNPKSKGRDGQASADRIYATHPQDFHVRPGIRGGNPGGRFPTNLLLDEQVAHDLDEAYGDRKKGGSIGQQHAGPVKRSVYRDDAVRSPFEGYGDTGGPSKFFFTHKANGFERNAGLDQRSTHPTVKPVRLNEYLSRLLLPPPHIELTALLNPFAGVGSEMIGAHLAGWDQVVGIERDETYATEADQRLDWWYPMTTYERAHAAFNQDRREERWQDQGQLVMIDQEGAIVHAADETDY